MTQIWNAFNESRKKKKKKKNLYKSHV